MLASVRGRAAARMTIVVVAMAICAGSTLARAPSDVEAAPPVNRPSPLAALEPLSLPVPRPAAPAEPGPFGLVTADAGSYAARWRILQPAIRVERQILALCRANPAACPTAAAKFGAIVEAARARDGLARIGEINRAVNLAIRPLDDLVQYGEPDIWASPLMTFGSGAGDCEDYAIAKYVALLEAGLAREDVRLIVVYNRPAHEQHMVAAARLDGRWLILDNRTMRLAADTEVADLAPLAMLDGADPALPAPAPQPAEARAEHVAGLALAL